MAGAVGVSGGVDLAHAGVEQCQHLQVRPAHNTLLVKARLFGQRQQRRHRQHPQARAQGQTLGHRTGGAQAGESTRTRAKADCIHILQAQPGLAQQLLHGGDQRVRSLRPAAAAVRPGAVFAVYRRAHGDRQDVGAGVKSQDAHGLSVSGARQTECPR